MSLTLVDFVVLVPIHSDWSIFGVEHEDLCSSSVFWETLSFTCESSNECVNYWKLCSWISRSIEVYQVTGSKKEKCFNFAAVIGFSSSESVTKHREKNPCCVNNSARYSFKEAEKTNLLGFLNPPLFFLLQFANVSHMLSLSWILCSFSVKKLFLLTTCCH